MVRADVWTADAPWSVLAALAKQSSNDGLLNRGMPALVTRTGTTGLQVTAYLHQVVGRAESA